MKKAVESGKGSSTTSHASVNGMRRELMRLPNSHQTDSSNQYAARDNDDFIQSESDRQTLLIKYFPSSLLLIELDFACLLFNYGITLFFLIDFCISL